MPLELKQQRILPAKIGRTLYRYTVRPITREEWLAYYDSVTYEQKNDGDALVTSSESRGSRIELLGKVLLNVDGYQREGDAGHVTDLPNWTNLLPISHRAAFADLLFETGLDPAYDAQPSLGEEVSVLRSRWTQDDAGKGDLVEFGGLLHVFAVPSIDQQRRYSRDASRSRIVGGRKGRTQFLGAQRTLVELYDELIQRVKGYTADGQALDDKRDLIVAAMDTHHKVQAMGAVFAPAEPDADEVAA